MATESASDWVISAAGGGLAPTVLPTVEVVTLPVRATATDSVVTGFFHSRSISTSASSPMLSTR